MATAAATKSKAKTRTKAFTPGVDNLRETADMLKMAGDATRLNVLLLLVAGPMNVTELCKLIGSSQPAVSHHLALMRAARLVEPRRAGKTIIYSLTEAGRRLAETASALSTRGD